MTMHTEQVLQFNSTLLAFLLCTPQPFTQCKYVFVFFFNLLYHTHYLSTQPLVTEKLKETVWK